MVIICTSNINDLNKKSFDYIGVAAMILMRDLAGYYFTLCVSKSTSQFKGKARC